MPYDILQQSILTTVTIPGEEAYYHHATTSNKSEQQHYCYSRKRRGEKRKKWLAQINRFVAVTQESSLLPSVSDRLTSSSLLPLSILSSSAPRAFHLSFPTVPVRYPYDMDPSFGSRLAAGV